MQETTEIASIITFRQKLHSLESKIVLQQSFAEVISAEFGSLQREFELLPYNVDSSSDKFESTNSDNGSTSFDVESIRHKIESTSSNAESTKQKIESTSANVESMQGNAEAKAYKERLAAILEKSAKEKLNIYFGQPNIPNRMATVLAALIEKKKLSVAEMRTITGASRNSLVRDVAIIKKLGWIKFNGSRKNGYFTFTGEGEEAVK